MIPYVQFFFSYPVQLMQCTFPGVGISMWNFLLCIIVIVLGIDILAFLFQTGAGYEMREERRSVVRRDISSRRKTK